jgi:hypothetical protein
LNVADESLAEKAGIKEGDIMTNLMAKQSTAQTISLKRPRKRKEQYESSVNSEANPKQLNQDSQIEKQSLI